MIDICMLTCNRRRITELSIKALRERTHTPHRLTVLDNGSTDGTTELLSELLADDWIDMLYTADKNRGVHWGFNVLLDGVESDLYVCTDNDLIPQSPIDDGLDWLALLVKLMDEYPDYAAISCLPHHLIGDSLDLWLDGAGPVIERPWCGAALRVMRTQAVRETGGWRNTQDPSRDNEERWICSALRESDWKTGYARDVRCIHLWGEPDMGEDPWGYDGSLSPEDHGHRAIHPPPDHYNWHRLGIDWETCR